MNKWFNIVRVLVVLGLVFGALGFASTPVSAKSGDDKGKPTQVETSAPKAEVIKAEQPKVEAPKAEQPVVQSTPQPPQKNVVAEETAKPKDDGNNEPRGEGETGTHNGDHGQPGADFPGQACEHRPWWLGDIGEPDCGTPIPTGTPVPTNTPTSTPVPTETPVPSETPTSTPVPTETPVPTNEPEPGEGEQNMPNPDNGIWCPSSAAILATDRLVKENNRDIIMRCVSLETGRVLSELNITTALDKAVVGDDSHPTLTDDKRVVWSRQIGDNQPVLFSANFDGSNPTALKRNNYALPGVEADAHGNDLIAVDPLQGDIFTLNNGEDFSTLGETGHNPDWSADGQWHAMVYDRFLKVSNADGVFSTDIWCNIPRFMPSGKGIDCPIDGDIIAYYFHDHRIERMDGIDIARTTSGWVAIVKMDRESFGTYIQIKNLDEKIVTYVSDPMQPEANPAWWIPQPTAEISSDAEEPGAVGFGAQAEPVDLIQDWLEWIGAEANQGG